MTDRVRVLIADDQRVVRDGLTMLVELMDGVQLIGSVEDGEQAVERALAEHPDVVLMDLRMPRMDGVEATRLLVESIPGVAVVVLTTYADDDSVLPALEAGARAYLTKDAAAEQIEAAILDAHAGRTHLGAEVQQRLVQLAIERGRAAAEPASVTDDGLTPREIEVLKLIANGKDNAMIAAELHISPKTVKNHISNILMKLQIENRIQAAVYAVRSGIV